MTDTEWLSTAEAADRLGMATRDVYRLINDGKIEGYRFGRVIRLKADDVDRWRDDGPGTASVPARI